MKCYDCKYFRDYLGGYQECAATLCQIVDGMPVERCPGYELPKSCAYCSKYWINQNIIVVDGKKIDRIYGGCTDKLKTVRWNEDCPNWEAKIV